MRRAIPALVVVAIAVAAGAPAAFGRQTTRPATRPADAPPDAAAVRAAVDKLGSLEFETRSGASRTIRRAEAAVAVPILIDAAKSHSDGYARFRALVLVSSFNDARTRYVMVQMLSEKNDRLRSAAYTWFEHHPDVSVLPRLVEAAGREESEFVRPALMRAIAAHGSAPAAQDAMRTYVMKGQAFFRSIVIEALGDHRGAYALKPLLEITATHGPLQDDAAVALGKIGDKSALPALAKMQQSAARETQPAIAAAICLLGVNCASHEPFIGKSLAFAVANIGFQELLRAAATALGALATGGRESALVTLIEQGAPTRDPARAAIALAVGAVALRNTPLFLKVAERDALRAPAIELLREAFDMLEEDMEEEQFFAAVRRAYWQAPVGSRARATAETLILKLEF